MPSNPPLPPGRFGLPLIGESLAFAKDPAQFLLERFQRYGPVFKTSVLGMKLICFIGREGFAFFHDPANVRRHGANPGSVIQSLGGPSSSHFLDGSAHRRRKRLTLKTFWPNALAEYTPRMEAITRRHLARWVAKGEVSGVEAFHRLALAIGANLILGTPVSEDAEELYEPLTRAARLLAELPLNLPGTAYHAALQANRAVSVRVRHAVDEYVEGDSNALVGWLFATRFGDTKLAVDEIHAEATDNFFTIFNGMGSALALATLGLSNHPEVVDRARSELLAGRSEYLDRAMHEARRYFPMFSIPGFGIMIADREFHGYHIPKGWHVTAAIHATHRDPSIFHDADAFDTERFCPGGEATPLNTYVAHAGGTPDEYAHHCSAEPFADAMLVLVMRTILRSHTWELPPQDLALDPKIVPFPQPRDGLRIRFRRI